MARLPWLEFASQILPASLSQFSNKLRILCSQPILQLIQRFQRGKHRHWNFNNTLGHGDQRIRFELRRQTSGHRYQQQGESGSQDQKRSGPDDGVIELFLHVFPKRALHQVEPEQDDDDAEGRA